MESWPVDRDKPESAENILKYLTAVYRKVMNNPSQDYSYNGFDIGQKEKASIPSLAGIATKSDRKYNAERNRDEHDVFLLAALQLGIEQGRRLERESQKSFIKGLKGNINLIKGKHKLPKDILDFYVKSTEEYLGRL